MQIRDLTLTITALLLLGGAGWLLVSINANPAAAPEDRTLNPAPEGTSGGTSGGTSEDRPDNDPLATADADRTLIHRSGDPTRREVRVRGRVVDRYFEPLAQATVRGPDQPPATTAADGHFKLTVHADRSITLLVEAPKHAPFLSEHSLEEAPSSLDVGDIQLLSGGGITGQILDQVGHGLPRATATLRPTSGSRRRAMEAAGLLAPAGTDKAGIYRFQNVMPGTYRVMASAAGMQETRSARSVEVKEGVLSTVDPIRLEVGFELHGIVVGPTKGAARAPVAGASVRVRCNQPRYRGQVQTGSDGRFQLQQLPPGPLQVQVTARGFLGFSRQDVDATRGKELVVQLEGGLGVTGTVFDSKSGKAVERFAAAIRRTGPLDARNLGNTAHQLRRKIQELRAPAAGDTPEQRTRKAAIAATFQARLQRLQRDAKTRPAPVNPNIGPEAPRPGGRFAFHGLDEGRYTVDIASGSHQLARVEQVEVRRGVGARHLRIELTRGRMLQGTVVYKHDDKPVAGAQVALKRVVELSPQVQEHRRSLYPWAFARRGPLGVTILSARTDDQGRFVFRQAAPGRYFLSTRHPRTADHDTDVLYLQNDQDKIRIQVGLRAEVNGRIHGIPPQRRGHVSVLLLGGYGTMRTVMARPDGSYRCKGLQPGSYIVRAFPADARRYVSRQLARIFAPGPAVADPKKTPRRDLTVAPGESRSFDLSLDLPPAGTVQGRVAINGRPGKGGRVILRPKPGAAPGSGGLSLRATLDELGTFSIADVPVGKYTLRAYGASRQELHSEPLTVTANETSRVDLELVAGGLRGRVTTPDSAAADQVRGYVMVLPGATKAPDDVRAYRLTHRLHRVRVRDGAFHDEGLTPGPAVLIVDIRGYQPVSSRVVIPTGATLALDLNAGGVR